MIRDAVSANESEMMNSEQRRELEGLCRSVCWDANMAYYSTFRTGGVVEALVEIGDGEELTRLMPWLHRHRIPWRVVGGGSNILVTSRYHQGVFIRLRGSVAQITFLATEDPQDSHGCRVRVSAGCSLASFIGWCCRNGLSGLEDMAGIPGSVGGAIRMNAGAFGITIAEVLESVRYSTAQGELREASSREIAFGYRHTRLPGEPEAQILITTGIFRLVPADRRQVAARCREIIEWRKQKQPSGLGSAGSFFKNPEGEFAGRLIERAGLKGLTLGKAMVSPKHANFIVNTGGAIPEDIIGLMQAIRERVLQQSGILLEPEVQIF